MHCSWTYLAVLCLLVASCQSDPKTLFDRLHPRHTGIEFRNTLKESNDFNVMKYGYFYNGGGVAIGDLDNNGLQDIYFTGNLVASRLYLNQGSWAFDEVAADVGVAAEGLWNTGVTLADVNADGWLDIYVCRSAAVNADARRNLLFINQGSNSGGQISFVDEAERLGLDDQGYSTQAAFFDADLDGDLDMYLLNHSLPQYADFSSYIGQLKHRVNPYFGDKLYRNDDGKFVDVTSEAGIKANVLGFGLGVAISDLNGDGWPDIYVSNDFNEEDYLYINQQDGTFAEQLSGAMNQTSLFSMGSDAADVNNDGHPDVVTLDMLPGDHYRNKLTSGPDNFDKYEALLSQGFHPQVMRNMLQVNDGQGHFREMGQLAGISNTDWSWSALVADYDLDGWQDLFVTNGYLRDYTNMDFLSYAVDMKVEGGDIASEEGIEELLEHMPKIEVPNQIFKNIDGTRFSDRSKSWGFTKIELSNGAAYGDLDNDGDLDLVVNNVNDYAGVYRNTAVERAMGNFLKIKISTDNTTTAFGTKVTLYSPSGKQHRELHPTRGFQSSVEPSLFFGLGSVERIDSLIVQWPLGDLEKFDYVPINALLVLKQGTGVTLDLVKAPRPTTAFQEVDLIPFRHRENNFNDFRGQSLLPRYYSRLGPKIAAADFDGDGREEIICAGAADQPTTMFRASGQAFTTKAQPAFEADQAFEDVALVARDLDGDLDVDLLIASGGNAKPHGDSSYFARLYLNDGRGHFARDRTFPTVLCHAHCADVADYDGDGDPDIFLGGAYRAQLYPTPEANHLLINDGSGQFTAMTDLPFEFHKTTAVESADVHADGQIDLILAGEWERIEIWTLQDGRWELTQSSPHKGLWTALCAANLDADPALEIVAGNHGRNSQWQASPQAPMILYSGDFDDNGTIDPVLTTFHSGESYPFVSRDDLVGQLAAFKKYFVSYADYAGFSTADFLGLIGEYHADSVQELNSVCLDLAEDGMRTMVLPDAAQLAPLFSIQAIDYDGDGDQDLVLAGNQKYNRVKLGEMQANHGVLLENHGELSFSEVPPAHSGLAVDGDIRDGAVITVTGTRHIVFARNDGPMISYRLHAPD